MSFNQLLSRLRIVLLLVPLASQAASVPGSLTHTTTAGLSITPTSGTPAPVTLALIGFGIGFAGGCLKLRKSTK